jgi:hypothetical protein
VCHAETHDEEAFLPCVGGEVQGKHQHMTFTCTPWRTAGRTDTDHRLHRVPSPHAVTTRYDARVGNICLCAGGHTTKRQHCRVPHSSTRRSVTAGAGAASHLLWACKWYAHGCPLSCGCLSHMAKCFLSCVCCCMLGLWHMTRVQLPCA